MSPFDRSKFIGRFVEEAEDTLQHLNDALLNLEKDSQNREGLKDSLRLAHNLKGSAKMLGLQDIAQVSHIMEDILMAVDEGERFLSPEIFDVLFRFLDTLMVRVERLGSGKSEPEDARAAVGRRKSPEGRRSGRLAQRKRSLRVSAEKIDHLAGLAAEMTSQKLRSSERHLQAHRLLIQLRRLRDGMQNSDQWSGSSPGLVWRKQAHDLEILNREVRRFVEELDGDQARLNLIAEEFRRSVIAVSMVPLGTVFDAFPRTIRDLARELGKTVALTIRGGEVELDRSIIETLGDPLVHLLRNAVSHGIEEPSEREKAGKPSHGQVLLEAVKQGDRLVITVQDDGRGIDPGALRTAAVEKNLAHREELHRWSNEEVLDLVFEPGFSTTHTVTAHSGRGVGLDAVRKAVEHLNGTVRVFSEMGVGTTVRLDLPLTMASIRGVLVQSGSELFAILSPGIERIVYLEPSQILSLQDGQGFESAGETVALVPLANLLRVDSAPAPPPWPVIIGKTVGQPFGLLVDDVLPEQELVVKELPKWLREQRHFSGATILGNGRIVLILELHAVFQSATQSEALRAPVAIKEGMKKSPASILVVEDSFVTGEMERTILQGAGYRAEIACDGIDALDMLRNKKYDLVVADVDMPRMDGYEMTARMRQEDRLREIPVVIVSACESSDDRRRGIDAGADAYIFKRDFDQNQLLEIIRRLVGR